MYRDWINTELKGEHGWIWLGIDWLGTVNIQVSGKNGLTKYDQRYHLSGCNQTWFTCRAVNIDKSTLASSGDNLSAAVANASTCSCTDEGINGEMEPSNNPGKCEINKREPSWNISKRKASAFSSPVSLTYKSMTNVRVVEWVWVKYY